MPYHIRLFMVVAALAAVVGALLVNRPVPAQLAEVAIPDRMLAPSAIHEQPLPDFSAFRDARAKKRAFIAYMAPLIEQHNLRLLTEREALEAMAAATAAGQALDADQRERLQALAERYGVALDAGEPQRALILLLRRVDIVPVSLALIQSANESGWGTSRLAQQGNNLFGEKCFRSGCGFKAAGSGRYARFDDPGTAVASYIHNLNTHPAYADFRKLRERLRDEAQPLTGTALADGLHRYSERGELYVQELQHMIRRNRLERLDEF